MRRGTWLSRAAVLEEYLLSPVPCHSGITNNWGKLQGCGQREAVAALALEWQWNRYDVVTGICSGAKDSSLVHKQDCT